MYALGLIWIGILFSAVGSSTDSIYEASFHFADEKFYWPPQQNDIRYPTCELSSNGIHEFDDTASLADYAFLAGSPYKKDDVIEQDLSFFKNSDYNITHDTETVRLFREANGYNNTAVKFDLYRIQHVDENKESAIVSIRGTHTAYDLLADLQLWSAAMLMQIVRAILPLGEIWTPVFDELIYAMSQFQSTSLEQISFYIVTTAFVKDIKEQGIFDSVQITGHSLGGGLAIITGAQSKTPAVALSGPNALMSGKTFKPQVVKADLNRYTFNIIPNRDPVPRFDDVADNFQRIRCNAAGNNFAGCHDATRSLCEIMYTCGSGDRPIPCECIDIYNFEEPVSLSTFNEEGRETFREECDYLYSLDESEPAES
jgi:lipase ATG15